MNTWSFYHKDTGLFSPTTSHLSASVDPQGLAPVDHIAISGKYDPLRQRVDVTTLQVIAREVTDVEHQAIETRRILAQIEMLENSSSHRRAHREAILGNEEGLRRLQDIERKIVALRAMLPSSI